MVLSEIWLFEQQHSNNKGVLDFSISKGHSFSTDQREYDYELGKIFQFKTELF